MRWVAIALAKEQRMVFLKLLETVAGSLCLIRGCDILRQNVGVLIGHSQQQVAGDIGIQRGIEVLGGLRREDQRNAKLSAFGGEFGQQLFCLS